MILLLASMTHAADDLVVSFDGSNDYVFLPPGNSLGYTPSGTVEGWFYADVHDSSPNTIWGAGTGWPNVLMLFLQDGRIRFQKCHQFASGVNDCRTITVSETLQANRWYHFALVNDCSPTPMVKLFLNGHLEASSTDSEFCREFLDANVALGRRHTSNYFDGFLDHIRIWVRDLTDAEVLTVKDITDNADLYSTSAGAGVRTIYPVTTYSGSLINTHTTTYHGTYQSGAGYATYAIPQVASGQQLDASVDDAAGSLIGALTVENTAGANIDLSFASGNENGWFELQGSDLHWSSLVDPSTLSGQTVTLSVRTFDGRFETDIDVTVDISAPVEPPSLNQTFLWGDVSLADGAAIANLDITDPGDLAISDVTITNAVTECEVETCNCTSSNTPDCRTDLPADLVKVVKDEATGQWNLHWRDDFRLLTNNHRKIYAASDSLTATHIAPYYRAHQCGREGFTPAEELNPIDFQVLGYIEVTIQMENASGGVGSGTLKLGFYNAEPLPSFSTISGCSGSECDLTLSQWNITNRVCSDTNTPCTSTSECNVGATCDVGYPWYKVEDIVSGAVSTQQGSTPLGTDPDSDVLGISLWCTEGNIAGEDCIDGIWQYAQTQADAELGLWNEIKLKEAPQDINCPAPNFCIYNDHYVPAFLLPPEAILRYKYDTGTTDTEEFFKQRPVKMRLWDQTVGNAFEYWTGDGVFCARLGSLSTTSTTVFLKPDIYETPQSPVLDDASILPDPLNFFEEDPAITNPRVISGVFSDANIYDSHTLEVIVEQGKEWAVSVSNLSITSPPGQSAGSFSFVVEPRDNYFGEIDFTIRVTDQSLSALADSEVVTVSFQNMQDDVQWLAYDGRGLRTHRHAESLFDAEISYVSLPGVNSVPQLSLANLQTVEMWFKPICDGVGRCWNSILKPLYTNHDYGLQVQRNPNEPSGREQTQLCLFNTGNYCTATETGNFLWDREQFNDPEPGWIHVAMVLEPQGSDRLLRFYKNGEILQQSVDGQLVDERLVSNITKHPNANSAAIGGTSGLAGLNVVFDDVRVWSIPLSADSLTSGMFMRPAADKSGLVLNFSFDQPDFSSGNQRVPNEVDAFSSIYGSLQTCQSGACSPSVSTDFVQRIAPLDNAFSRHAEVESIAHFHFPRTTWFQEGYPETQLFPDFTTDEDEAIDIRLRWLDMDVNQTPTIELTQTGGTGGELSGIQTLSAGVFRITPSLNFVGTVDLKATLTLGGLLLEETFQLHVLEKPDPIARLPGIPSPSEGFAVSNCVFTENDNTNSCALDLNSLFYDPDSTEWTVDILDIDGVSSAPSWLTIVRDDNADMAIELEGDAPLSCLDINASEFVDVQLTAKDSPETGASVGIRIQVNGIPDSPAVTLTADDLPVPLGGFFFEEPFPAGNTITEDDVDNDGIIIRDAIAYHWYADDDVCEPATSTMGVALYEAVRGDWEFRLAGTGTWVPVGDLSESEALLLGAEDYLRVQPDGLNGIPGDALIKLYLWDDSDGQSAGASASVISRGPGTPYSLDRLELNLEVLEVPESVRLKDGVPEPQEAEPALLCSGWIENEAALNPTVLQNACSFLASDIFDSEDTYTLGLRGTLEPGTETVAWASLSEDTSDPNQTWNVISGSGDQPCLPQSAQGTASLYLVATDGADNEAVARVDVAITGTNDSPVVINGALTLPDMDENDVNHPGVIMGDVLANAPAGADDDQCLGTLSLGLAINHIVSGQWQYSVSETEQWVDLENISESQALLLPAYARLRAQVDGIQGGEAQLSGYLWDGTGIGAPLSVVDVSASELHGGIRSLSVDTVTITQPILEVTDPPVLTPNSLVVSETAPVDTPVGFAVEVDDPDNSPLEFSFVNPPVDLPFSIDPSTGEISVSGALDYEQTQQYVLDIEVVDGLTSVLSSTTIDVENENDEAPVFGDCPASLLINGQESAGETLVALGISDADVSTPLSEETLTISMSGDAMPPLTELNWDRLVLAQPVDTHVAANGPRTLELTISAQDGLFTTTCDISITINESPTVDVDAFADSWVIAEGQPIGTVVGLPAVATDPEGDTASFYGFANGWNNTPHPDLIIDAQTGVVTTQTIFDYESRPAPFTLFYVMAMDQTSASARVGIKVWIQDVNEPPVFTTSSILVPQTADVTTPFATLPVVDPEGTQLEVLAEEHEVFEIDESGDLYVKLDEQAPGCTSFHANCRPLYDRVGESFLVNVSATDGEHTATTTLLLTVVEVDEAPEISSPPSDTLAHPLWLQSSTIRFPLAAWDPDGEDITWELEQADAGPPASLASNKLDIILGEATQGVFHYTLRAFDGTKTTERALNLHLFRRDTDGDGLSDIFESNAGTLMDNVDSDGDGIHDFDESACPAPFRGENIGPTSIAEGFPCTTWYACDVHTQAVIDLCAEALDSDDDGQNNALDADSDNDGLSDADEAPMWDGDADDDGLPNYLDADADDDGILDGADNCWLIPNALQADLDGDQLGDACDESITIPTDGGQTDAGAPATDGGLDGGQANPDGGPFTDGGSQTDSGTPYELEIPDASMPPVQIDDDDSDGLMNSLDNCPEEPNADQADLDRDGLGDLCDDDMDNDGLENGSDNCTTVYNPGQNDLDEDTLGDACDTDVDGDGIENAADNCPYVDNENQEDSDSDGIGDACTAAPELVDGGVDIITPDEPEPAPACVCLKTKTDPPLGLAILLLVLVLPQLSRRSRS